MNAYHIYDEIGRGKGTLVYKGRMKKTIEYVAIKSVDRSYKSKILHEVSVMYNMDHRNVLKFMNWYETSNHIWVILEYCTGADLLTLIRQDLRLPNNAIQNFAHDVLLGLQYIHWRGFIHGALKPSNILINEYGDVKLSGFGLSCPIPNEANVAYANAMSRRGTPYYMAPELFHADGIQSFASDFWAFGCILYELAHGRPPFYSRSVQELVNQIMYATLPALNEGCGDDFAHLLNRCLEKDPFKRITWDELRVHPYLKKVSEELGEIPVLILPKQEVFERLAAESALREKNGVVVEDASKLPTAPLDSHIDPTRQQPKETLLKDATRSTNVPLIPAQPAPMTRANAGEHKRQSNSGRVDVVRLSNNVKRNWEEQRAAGHLELEDGDSHSQSLSTMDVDGDDKSNIPDVIGSSKFMNPSEPSTAKPKDKTPRARNSLKKGDVPLRDFDSVVDFGSEQDQLVRQSVETLEAKAVAPTVDTASTHHVESGVDGVTSSIAVGDISEIMNASSNTTIGGDESLLLLGDGNNAQELNAPHDPTESIFGGEDEEGENPQTPTDWDAKVSVSINTLPRSKHAKPAPDTKPPIAKLPVTRTTSVQNVSNNGRPTSTSKTDLSNTLPTPPTSARSHTERKTVGGISPKIYDLVLRTSDMVVRPLVGNTRIEKLPVTKFQVDSAGNVKTLKFKALTVKELLDLNQAELETFLTNVFREIGGGAANTLNKRITAIVYLQSVCVDTQIANIVINSSLMKLFVKMLTIFKSASLKVNLLSVMGFLLRHATFISQELSQSGVVVAFADLLRDTRVAIRRRAACALGELLFYIATQESGAAVETGEEENKGWEVPEYVITLIKKSLRANEDDIVKHYCIKTVENISAQCPSHCTKWFASSDVVFALIQTYSSTKNSRLQISCISSLSLLFYRDPPLVSKAFDSMTWPFFLEGLSSSVPSLQQRFINLLNLSIYHASSRFRPMFTDSKRTDQLISVLVKLIVNPAGQAARLVGVTRPNEGDTARADRAVTRLRTMLCGKALLCVSLLGLTHLNLALKIFESKKFVVGLDQLYTKNLSQIADGKKHGSRPDSVRDKGEKIVKYVYEALMILANVVISMSEERLSTLVTLLKKTAGRKNIPQDSVQAISTAMCVMPLLRQCLGVRVLRTRLLTPDTVVQLSQCLGLLDQDISSSLATQAGNADRDLLEIVDLVVTVTAQPTIMIRGQIIGHLLPALLLRLESNSSSHVTSKFRSLQLVGDCLLALMQLQDVYHSGSSVSETPEDVPTAALNTTAQINRIIIHQLLPRISSIMATAADPFPLYCLKVLGAIFNGNKNLIVHAGDVIQSSNSSDEKQASHDQQSIAKQLMSFFVPETTTVQCVRLVALLAASGHERIMRTMFELGIVQKVSLILANAVKSGIEEFYEYLVDIVYSLLTFTAQSLHSITSSVDTKNAAIEVLQATQAKQQELLRATEPLVSNVELFVQLLSEISFEAGDPDADVTSPSNTNGMKDSSGSGSSSGSVVLMNKTAQSLLLITRLYPHFSDLFLTPHNLRQFSMALAHASSFESNDNMPNPLAPMQRFLLQSILLICRRNAKYVTVLHNSYNMQLLKSIEELAAAAPPVVEAPKGPVQRRYLYDPEPEPEPEPAPIPIAQQTAPQLAVELSELMKTSK